MKPRRPAVGGPVVWAYTGIQWLIFAVVQTCITFTFSTMPKSVGFLVICCLVACGALHANRSRNIHFQPMTVAVGLATVLASFLGFYNYDANELLSTYYYNARDYTNVVPSEQALAFSDAGVIDFTDESVVDIARSVGYNHKGTMYCIAPITDRTYSAKIEFWATGVNCCPRALGDFFCDESKNVHAHSGAVVFDNVGWFADSNHDFYQLAKNKATAAFDLVSAGHPTFVRWTTNDKKYFLRDSYHQHALLIWGVSLAVYALVSYILAIALVKASVPPRQF
eukprot:GEMP01052063.1.p1 GENE.GEMP01052063.1~~GEMP01052063.1.p1  ORF type:complete len:281 (+),score=53.63 GEMP01052063.1:241-1083(+)